MSHVYYNEIVVIDGWRQDETYDGVYPEGARDKIALFSPGIRNQEYIKPDWRYLFKLSRSDEWCPWQFWMEVIAYRFGRIIGVEVPPAWPAVSNKYKDGEKTYGALIEWFYNEESSLYLNGGQLMTEWVENFDREKGTNHNWMILYKKLNILKKHFKYDTINNWAKVLTF